MILHNTIGCLLVYDKLMNPITSKSMSKLLIRSFSQVWESQKRKKSDNRKISEAHLWKGDLGVCLVWQFPSFKSTDEGMEDRHSLNQGFPRLVRRPATDTRELLKSVLLSVLPLAEEIGVTIPN